MFCFSNVSRAIKSRILVELLQGFFASVSLALKSNILGGVLEELPVEDALSLWFCSVGAKNLHLYSLAVLFFALKASRGH